MVLREGDSCPYCEVGKLIIKSGRFSNFLGCDMYRHTGCGFIKGLKGDEFKNSLEKEADEILALNKKEYLIV